MPASHQTARLHKIQIQVQGSTRTCFSYLPPAQPGRTVPLVLIFHGGAGNGQMIAETSGFHHLAATHGFAVAFPSALGRWNDGRQATREHGDDLAFMDALVARFVAEHHVDPRRVYAAGISNGGLFAYRLACDRPDLLAAVAAVNASLPARHEDFTPPPQPLPVLIINGTADTMIPWGGGTGQLGHLLAPGEAWAPVPETVEFWRRANRCSRAPIIRDLRLQDNHAGIVVKVMSYPGSKPRATLLFVMIEGGGHGWPGGKLGNSPIDHLVGEAYPGVDASQLIWTFFEQTQTPPLRLSQWLRAVEDNDETAR